MMNFLASHQEILLTVLGILGLNAVAALRPIDELHGMTKAEAFYDWFYRWVKGCAQQIPKAPGPQRPAVQIGGQQVTVNPLDAKP